MNAHSNMTRAIRPPLARGLAHSFLAAAVVIALAVPATALADSAETSLEKYKQPVDEAVEKALTYLAKAQNPDGSFPDDMGGCTAVTSLSVMAFLAKGHTPGRGPYGEAINKGIDFVISTRQANGTMVSKGKGGGHGPMYNHTIATLMLSEVSGMVDPARQKRIDAALPKAMQVILAAQAVTKPAPLQGGWRYQPNSADSDLSCSGWALMSLRSARNNGTDVPKGAIEDALKFVASCRAADGGYGYQPGGGASLAMTSVALLSMELCGLHRDKNAVAAGEWVLRHLPKTYGEGFFYYALYYSSQAMFQLGGEYWEKYAAHLYQMMLKYQQADGSWPQGSGNEAPAGLCYSTAMGVLAVSVSYRQLPIYQR